MPYLLFSKKQQNLKSRLLQIIGGALWVNPYTRKGTKVEIIFAFSECCRVRFVMLYYDIYVYVSVCF